MSRLLFIILVMLYGSLSCGETVYRQQQDDGGVVFSDTAADGAQSIELQQVPTIKIESLASSTNGPQETQGKTGQAAPTIELISPADQQTVWHDSAGIEVTVGFKPALPAGSRVVISVDGEDVASGSSEVINVGVVYRGSHVISARIESEKGRVIAATPTATFHVRQHSRIKPPFLQGEDSNQ